MTSNSCTKPFLLTGKSTDERRNRGVLPSSVDDGKTWNSATTDATNRTCSVERTHQKERTTDKRDRKANRRDRREQQQTLYRFHFKIQNQLKGEKHTSIMMSTTDHDGNKDHHHDPEEDPTSALIAEAAAAAVEAVSEGFFVSFTFSFEYLFLVFSHFSIHLKAAVDIDVTAAASAAALAAVEADAEAEKKKQERRKRYREKAIEEDVKLGVVVSTDQTHDDFSAVEPHAESSSDAGAAGSSEPQKKKPALSHEEQLAHRRDKDRKRYAGMTPEERMEYNRKRREQYHRQSEVSRQKRRERERHRYHALDTDSAKERNARRAKLERLRYNNLSEEELEAKNRRRRERAAQLRAKKEAEKVCITLLVCYWQRFCFFAFQNRNYLSHILRSGLLKFSRHKTRKGTIRILWTQ